MSLAERRKYWGVKSQIGFRKRYPLGKYWYAPVERGTPISLNEVGPSWKEASAEQRAKRKAFNMTGRGQYAMRGRGGFFGRMLGGLFGQPDLGDKVGDMVWSGAKQFLPSDYANLGDAAFKISDQMGGRGLYKGRGLYRGRGAYAVNNLVTDGGATASDVVPQFQPKDIHDITYSNREFVRDVYAPPLGTLFLADSWNLNPGLVQSFPWLSQIALNFEEYEFVQLAFTYKSTVADFASASGQVGQVAIATQYNPNSDTFADKEEMMLYEGGMSCKTTESLIHGIECDPSKLAGAAQKYVRQGSIPLTEDLKNYDLGKTTMAVLNVPSTYASQQIGELWVSYTVKLRKPKLVSANAYNIRCDKFVHAQTSPLTALPSATTPILTIGTLAYDTRNSVGATITVADAGALAPVLATSDNLTALVVAPGTPVGVPTKVFTQNTFAQQQQFTITLPPDYSGIIMIRIVQHCNTSGNPRLIAVTNTRSIARFRDIPGIYNTMANSVWTHFRNSTADDLISQELELHLRVLPAQGGLPNAIIISTESALFTSTAYSFPRIEISQYNSFLSVADNGTNDRLDLATIPSQQPFTWANL